MTFIIFLIKKTLLKSCYNYKVDADFYKKILDKDVYQEISDKEDRKELKKGDIFPTKEGTIITFINNNHVCFMYLRNYMIY